MKQIAGTLKLELAQYREVAAFAQFGSDLDTATKNQLKRGQVLTQLLKQAQYEPSNLVNEIGSIFIGVNGYLDGVNNNFISLWERSLLDLLSFSDDFILFYLDNIRSWESFLVTDTLLTLLPNMPNVNITAILDKFSIKRK